MVVDRVNRARAFLRDRGIHRPAWFPAPGFLDRRDVTLGEGRRVLHAFAFERIGVVVGDIYFRDVPPSPDEEGREQGVRLEVRYFERRPLRGSAYSAQPIFIGEPLWRADILESVDRPGSFNRTHHHPGLRGWEPGSRVFDEALSADPLGWLTERLADLPALLHEIGVDVDDVPATDFDELRAAVPAILESVRGLLERVRAGELGRPPDHDDRMRARASWL